MNYSIYKPKPNPQGSVNQYATEEGIHGTEQNDGCLWTCAASIKDCSTVYNHRI